MLRMAPSSYFPPNFAVQVLSEGVQEVSNSIEGAAKGMAEGFEGAKKVPSARLCWILSVHRRECQKGSRKR